MIATHQTLVVGLGGAGCELAATCARRLHLEALYVNTDARHLERWPQSQGFLLRGPTSPHCAPLHRRAIETAVAASELAFFERLQNPAHIIFFAGLGGRTGTHAIAPLARAATRRGYVAVLAVTTPFDQEVERGRIAAQALALLRAENLPLFVYAHAVAQAALPDASMPAMLDSASATLADEVILWMKKHAIDKEHQTQ